VPQLLEHKLTVTVISDVQYTELECVNTVGDKEATATCGLGWKNRP